jgi:hypothetical protein
VGWGRSGAAGAEFGGAQCDRALLLYLRDQTGQLPHVYFGWTEGSPVRSLLRFMLFGEGDISLVTCEVLRKAEPDFLQRSRIHVSG